MDQSREIAEIASKFRLDSRETAVFSRQLEHLQGQTYDVLYPELKGRSLVPMGADQAGIADTQITYRQWDGFGMAKVIANFAQDLPKAGVAGKEFSAPIKSLGGSYEVSINDVRAAVSTGNNLPTRFALEAKEMIERAINHIILFGMAEAGTKGLLNHPNVPIVSLTTGTWSGATAAQVLEDLRMFAQSVVTLSKGTILPDTLVMDQASFAILTKPIGDNYLSTIGEVFLRTNPYIRNIEQAVELNTAGADGGPRLLCYKRDPKVCDLQIPLDFEQLPPEARSLAFVTAVHARICGVIIRYPFGLAYADNAG